MQHYRQRRAKHGSSNSNTIESLCCFSVERRPPFTAPIDSGRDFRIYPKSAVGALLFYSERCRKQCSSSFVSQSSEPDFHSACKWNLCHCSCNRNPLRARGHVSALCYRFTDGVGAQQSALEQRKKQLAALGVFDAARKRPLPAFPKKIGVVTSASGAAIHDIEQVIRRRFPLVQLMLFPAQVQGDSAPESISHAIQRASQSDCDVLIVGRGGGSAEDLQAFQTEVVVMAVFHCSIPVISAVGHEIDQTLTDYAADLRAPTPSAAAELAVPSMLELQYQIQANRKQLKTRMAAILQQKQRQWSEQQKLLSAASPEKRIAGLKKEVQANRHRLQQQMHKLLQEKQFQLQLQQTKLEGNHPSRILSKGYAIVRHGQQILSHADAVQAGDVLTIQLAHGTISVQVLAQEEET